MSDRKKREVAVVTEGVYSDYHIVGVFSSEEQAEAFCAAYDEKRKRRAKDIAFGWDSYPRVETYEVDTYVSGDLVFFALRSDCEGNFDIVSTDYYSSRDAIQITYTLERGVHILFMLYARDFPHAVKKAGELRTRLKAGGYLEIGRIINEGEHKGDKWYVWRIDPKEIIA